MARSILAAAAILFLVGVSNAGWLEDAVKRTGEGLGRRGVGEAGSSTYEGAKDAVKGTGKAGESQPASSTPQVRGAPGGEILCRQGGKADGDAGTAGDVSIEQAEAVYSKYDFIPGDKVIFFDDFSDTDVGEFRGSGPERARWKRVQRHRGAEYAGNGSFEARRPRRIRRNTRPRNIFA